jgi:hypothetical protein
MSPGMKSGAIPLPLMMSDELNTPLITFGKIRRSTRTTVDDHGQFP